jgi:pyruvate formate lyase activating enzyme
MDKALRDIPFYQRSGGGVTLGGGEPLAQPEFAAAILAACRRQGVHTAIETCGHVSPNVLENILRWTDLVLYDLKHVDMSVCRATLGADLALILANLERATESGAAITIRTPLIPGFNDRPDVLAAIAGRVRRLGVEEMHLLPYHRLGRRKNALLGREDPFANAEPLPAGRLEMLLQAVATTGMRVVLGG